MALINRSFFKGGEINIPNIDRDEIGEVVDLFIEKYELDFLTGVLGMDLYKDFIAGIAVTTPDQIWLDLLWGKDYEYSGRTYQWKGLVAKPRYTIPSLDKDGDLEILTPDDQVFRMTSPIAMYIYYNYVRNNATQTTVMGEVSAKTENAVNASPAHKMTKAWNEMSEWVYQLMTFLTANYSTYPSWNKTNSFVVLSKVQPINILNI